MDDRHQASSRAKLTAKAVLAVLLFALTALVLYLTPVLWRGEMTVATVMAVRPNISLVILSAGGADGIEIEQRFLVYRGDRRIGEVKIARTTTELSGGHFLPTKTGLAAQVGDVARKKATLWEAVKARFSKATTKRSKVRILSIR